MNKTIVQPSRDAMVEAKLKQKFGESFQGQITQSYLRMENDTVDGQGSYIYDIRSAKGNATATEFLLNENDSFHASYVALFLGVRPAANPAAAVLQTYPNQVVFADETAANPAGTFDPNHLEAFYNGRMQLKVGDTTFIPGLDLRNSRHVPNNQQTSASTKSQQDAKNGLISLHPPFTLSGKDNNELSIIIPAANGLKVQYTTAAHAGLRVFSCLYLIGYRITGGARVKNPVL